MHCKNCRHWRNGYCDAISIEDDTLIQHSGNLAEIVVKVADDHNLEARFRTLPDFGCVLFKDKSK